MLHCNLSELKTKELFSLFVSFVVGFLSACGVDAAGRLNLASNAMYTSSTARDDMLAGCSVPGSA